jgi:hypothetical protein
MMRTVSVVLGEKAESLCVELCLFVQCRILVKYLTFAKREFVYVRKD